MKYINKIIEFIKYALIFILLLLLTLWVNDSIFFPNQKSVVIYKQDTE